MAVINFENVKRASDLILKEPEPFAAYTRGTTKVTLTAGQTLEIGAVLVRAKSAAADAVYTVFEAADLVDTNDFAVYLADQLGEVKETVGAVTEADLLSIVRGNIILKDKAIYEAVEALGVTLTDPQKLSLKRLLANQGIVVEKVLG